MNRQRIVIVVLLVALGGLAVFIARNTYWTEETIRTPIQGEALLNPFYAAQKFSEALGARTDWRRVLGALPTNDSVIVLSAWHWNLIEQRSSALKRWVENGGRLVADRTLIGADKDLERWAGVKRSFIGKKGDKQSEAQSEAEDEEEAEEEKEGLGRLFKGERCSSMDVQAQEPGMRIRRAQYNICSIDSTSHLESRDPPSWAVSNEVGVQALRIPIGRGSVTLLNATPFRNEQMLEGDHALLFAAVTQLRRGDMIYFVSDDESESLIRIMWRYGAPVMVLGLALAALALWRGSSRFGPLAAIPDTARRSLGEQIRGTGLFTLRFGGGTALHAATVRALFEAARRRIVNFDGLPADERMAALSKAARLDQDKLAQAVNYSGPRRPGELRYTLALLESARRMILKRNER